MAGLARVVYYFYYVYFLFITIAIISIIVIVAFSRSTQGSVTKFSEALRDLMWEWVGVGRQACRGSSGLQSTIRRIEIVTTLVIEVSMSNNSNNTCKHE